MLLGKHPALRIDHQLVDRPSVSAGTSQVQPGVLVGLDPYHQTMSAAAGSGFSTATDLADWLVRELKLPFRDAHHVTGRIVALAEARGSELSELDLGDLQQVEPRITDAVFSVLSVDKSVASRTSHGGTAPQNVRKMARGWVRRLEKQGVGS